ncbi:Aminotransferase class III-fold pyridoxal phosphate-dependent enzyme [Sulfidibacter corallicola]|uniref:Aminotransferase class III-fold pyridoxal phosphate-dependent enzyme n=1 Tax=Sulfidibacter corallicola TaxID=2818388 RepID=A0A8A4TL33_SULCO|nr:aminotransferase class III-fold pyridoxal phosphate-dependent enzyme [Sulfidibacter corallicola]QTD49832.1 aminotransferase class III-fold pyridoxal phosphate-dependent enzyme [Sulfidibacter corallicola]
MNATLPSFSPSQAEALAARHYRLEGTATRLVSYADQNFLMRDAQDAKTVLKVSAGDQERRELDFQHRMLDHLAREAPDLQVPRLVPSQEGEDLVLVQGDVGGAYWMRLVTFLPGRLMADVEPKNPALFTNLGRFFGRMDKALEPFRHEAMHRELAWDLARGETTCSAGLDYLTDPERRALIENHLARYRSQTAPFLPHLRRSVIHNDGNDHNLLVDGDLIIGVIDFGDAVFSHTVNELAIVCAYAMLGHEDPLKTAALVVGGYHQAHPLTDLELRVLFDLILLRFCTSLCQSARSLAANPENTYLGVHAEPMWQSLAELATIPPGLAEARFRHACGLEPCPLNHRIVARLAQRAGSFAPVLGDGLDAAPRTVFDLRHRGTDYGSAEDRVDTERFSRFLFDLMAMRGTPVGLGRYNEDRDLYCDPDYDVRNSARRTVHLGVDLYVAPGRTVTAPLAGTVHSLRDNAAPGDYGPTLILAHDLGEGLTCYTLYGHLQRESLNGVTPGDAVAQGDPIAKVGDQDENGSWPPHLHFQVLCDPFDYEGDYPGIARVDQRDIWLSLCPDPNLILGLPELSTRDARPVSEAILAKRRAQVGYNLSISYRKPLHIVKGEGTWLFDADGRRYLDMVNNVCHVGHCHPHVVAAAQRQIATLNTNTRYLHQNLVAYAERLTATLPDPLSVCFFTCTGSEANDLALRLARTHTGGREVLIVDAAYHGHTNALIEMSPYKYEGPGGFDKVGHIHKLPMPDGYRGPIKHDDPNCGPRYAAFAEAMLHDMRERGVQPAGVFTESLLGCGGQIVLPPGYLTELYRLVRAAGGVCVADEVQVGFGRVGERFWGFETQDVVPDIVTLGKPIGNGHPMAAVVTTPEIAASFNNGMEYFNTFGGNPVSCAIGMAVLDVIENEGLQRYAAEVGGYLKAGLESLKTRHGLIGEVRGKGLFLGVELVRDHETLEPADTEASQIIEAMKDRGVLLSTDGPLHNVLKIKPPLAFGYAEADLALTHLDEVLSSMIG